MRWKQIVIQKNIEMIYTDTQRENCVNGSGALCATEKQNQKKNKKKKLNQCCPSQSKFVANYLSFDELLNNFNGS